MRHSNAAKYFLLSPSTTTLEKMGKTVLTWFSIKTGATFSPPAVIRSYFILPVIVKFPSRSIFPTSPEWTKPLLSIVDLVSYSFLKYPMKVFLPMVYEKKYL